MRPNKRKYAMPKKTKGKMRHQQGGVGKEDKRNDEKEKRYKI